MGNCLRNVKVAGLLPGSFWYMSTVNTVFGSL